MPSFQSLKSLAGVALLLIVGHTTVQAQCDYDVNTTDAFSGALRKVLTPKRLATNSVGALDSYFEQNGTTLLWYLSTTAKIGCANQYLSYVQIRFKTGEAMRLTHFGRTDCSKIPRLMFTLVDYEAVEGMSREEIAQVIATNRDRLATTLIDVIRVQGEDFYSEFELELTDAVIQQLECFR